MIKKTAPFLLLIFSFIFSLYADQITLVNEIALIDSEIYNQPIPPRKVIIGIELENDAYYKLTYQENIMKAGLLHRGLNILSLEANNLFEKSGIHTFLLGLKVGDLVLEKEIKIDIHLDTPILSEKKEAENKNIEYELSMFVGNELIISSKKMHYDKFQLKLDPPSMPKNYKPFHPNWRTDPFANSFSILDAVAGIYDLIKKQKTKKSEGKPVKSIQKWQRIVTSFIRKDPEGVAREVKATITISTKDL
jgi:hypothetical protein